MAETTLETAPGASYAVLITLTWSNLPVSGPDPESTVVRYTNWTEEVEVGEDTFLSVPDMEVDLGEIHGGTEDKPGKLVISRQFPPFNVFPNGKTHPKVHIKVEQCDPLDPEATRRQLFWGHLGAIQVNPGGRASLVSCRLNGIKAELKQIKLGIPAATTCQWVFGGTACGYDKDATKVVGTILSVGSPLRVSVQMSTGSGTTPNSNFKRGTLKVGGMSLPVRRSYDDSYLDLSRVPPEWIVGLPFELFEGCDKQYSTCTMYGRQSRFMGPGIRIPARQPLFEQ